MADTVRVKGLRELNKAFSDVDAGLRKELRAKLKAAGDLVRTDAASRFSRIDSRSAGGFKVRVRQGGVSVEQSLRRTTGQHPQYGALQMRDALLPAVDSQQEQVIRSIESMLDDLGDHAGF